MSLFRLSALLLLALAALPAAAERIKDLARIEGVRTNALIGYGLVVGLDGTGDQTTQAPFTTQSLRAMLGQLGVELPANVNPQLKNVAAVAIHAELPPFAKPGQTIDITVSSIGNAGSLRGGSLLMTPLRGVNGEVYAIAQGSVVVGGLGVSGNDGSRISINVPSAGRIPNGATVERTVADGFDAAGDLRLNLMTPDFTTAARMAEAINQTLGSPMARAVDAVTVSVEAPRERHQRVAFTAVLEGIEVQPGEGPARVVINSRTGTIVIGNHVRVRAAAVAHGSLAVTISEALNVSQPNPFGEGETVVTPQSQIQIQQGGEGRMFLFDAGVSLDDIVRAVNQVGAAPGDLVAILEALRQAGALRAELVVI